MKLAKLVAACAWADGKLSTEEINDLKDLLFRMTDVSPESGDEWTRLQMYLDGAVNAEERARLLTDVVAGVRSATDKQEVLRVVQQLVQADGQVSPQEEAVIRDVEQALKAGGSGLLGGLSRLMKVAIGNRAQALANTPNREQRIDDYIHHNIYYHLVSENAGSGHGLDLPDNEARKACLVGGLLACVAWADRDVSDAERDTIAGVLQRQWELSAECASVVSRISTDRVAQGLDVTRLTRGFFECTTHDERKRFIFLLFEIANACAKTSHDEIETIAALSRALRVHHQDFIEAKLSISRKDRAGL